ncbi:DNA-binding protein [Allochromatium vinosum]|uniref:Alpha-helical coiled-coil protein n=1 Tax=Allochromatium vinosum (strain ATCC 17899 / DSM 180 / NBRC 103801 / NCIMB 10441 / D) TaxID=572477 RepID=D3RWH2_ALLVD|nr:DNA-binding protein [Allochromatium vinosum]ADC64184.1 alpha-helical coiled-coil protein [Allochromatium vinosum DSM 180]
MRPVEVTDEAIIEAGRALVEQGRNVTGFALRQVIGSGAPNRLKTVWDRHQAQGLPQPEPRPLPDGIVNVLDRLETEYSKQLYKLALEIQALAHQEAEQTLQAGRDQWQHDRQALEQEVEDASQTVETLEQQMQELQEERERLRHELQQQATQIGTLQAQLEHAHQQVQTLTTEMQQEREQRTLAREQVARQEGELVALRKMQAEWAKSNATPSQAVKKRSRASGSASSNDPDR